MPRKDRGLGANPREATKAKLREFADLYRGGPDELRGYADRCYRAIHPTVSKKGAEARGSEYLNHWYTQEYLKEKTDAVAASADITQEYVLTTIRNTIERCSQAKPVIDKAGNPVMVETEDGQLAPAYTFDAANVLRGAELLGKNLKLWTDKTEHSGEVSFTIETAIPRDPDDKD